MKRALFATVVISLIIYLDKKYKKLSESKWSEEEIYILNDKIKLANLRNYGAFMGFLRKRPYLLLGLQIVTLVMVSILAIFKIINEDSYLTLFAYSLVIAGGVSNLTDRLKKGYVVDYISFRTKKDVHYNIGDFSIFTGLILLLVISILE